MLEKWMDSYAVFWAAGVIMALSVTARILRAAALRRLVKSAGRMGKSTHKLIKLVKAKFEHTYMLSNGVDNIEAFVDKYLYEYKICGLRIQSWHELDRQALLICAVFGLAGAVISYSDKGLQEMVFRYSALAAVGVMLLFLMQMSPAEDYRMKMVRVYMIDYLENICAPRYQRQQELQTRRMERTVQDTTLVNGDAERVADREEPDKTAPDQEEPQRNAPDQEVPDRTMPGKVMPEKAMEERTNPEMKEITPETEAPKEEEMKPEQGKEKRVPQEVILREIIEEFLA